MIGLLLAEVLALTLRFDARQIKSPESWFLVLFWYSHWFISLGITIVVLGGFVVWGVMQGDVELQVLVKPVGRRLRLWLPAHLASFAFFAWVTRSVFEPTSPTSSRAPWVALWISAGLATFVLWMLAVLPAHNWHSLWRRGRRAVLVGVVFGVGAVLVAYSTSQLWLFFHRSTFWAARGILGLFSHEVLCQPEKFVLGVNGFNVSIAPVCSGFEGIGLIWVFLAAYYWCFRHDLRFPHALLLIPLGTALSWIFNAGRIAALILAGAWGWENLALGGFHSQAGWLAFNAIGLGLVVLSRRVRLFSKTAIRPESEPTTTVNPTAVYVGPLLAIALTMMITGAFAEAGFDRLYPARVIAALAVFWYFRRDYAGFRPTFSWHAPAVGVAVYLLWMALEPAVPSTMARAGVPTGLGKMPEFWAAIWLAARVIGSAAVIPVAEELAFRGYLTRRLIASDFLSVPDGRFTWFSFLVSSLLFGLLHQDRWIAGTIAGMLFALTYYRRGFVADAIAAHATTNAILSAQALVTGDWSHWS